jgi:hypothetical protein
MLRIAPQRTLPVGSGTGWVENPIGRYRREALRSSIALGCNCVLLHTLCGAAWDVSRCTGVKVHQLIDWVVSKLPCIGKAKARAASPEG